MWSGVRRRASGEGCSKPRDPAAPAWPGSSCRLRVCVGFPQEEPLGEKPVDRSDLPPQLNIGSRSSGARVGGVRQ